MTRPQDRRIIPPGVEIAYRYRIIKHLGAGNIGSVYEAEHVGLGRRVALKVLHEEYVENERIMGRFLQEARAVAAVTHPGIVEVYDVGTEGELVFIAMELLEGEELKDRIEREHPLSEAFVVKIGVDLADAVAAAHGQGVIHRDLKPQNIYLATKGEQRDVVKVLDFGLAKLTLSGGPNAPMTRTGEVFGSPMYMPPEQLRSARDVDERTDVYAMGAVLYQALTGSTPYEARGFAELVIKIASQPPRPLETARPGMAPALARVIEHAMHREREERIQSAAELRDALAGCLSAM